MYAFFQIFFRMLLPPNWSRNAFLAEYPLFFQVNKASVIDETYLQTIAESFKDSLREFKYVHRCRLTTS